MPYRLLEEFANLFSGKIYRHRSSTQGDFVAMHLIEDLVGLDKSRLLRERVASRELVLNSRNRQVGVDARRGDGTFGEIVPGLTAVVDPG